MKNNKELLAERDAALKQCDFFAREIASLKSIEMDNMEQLSSQAAEIKAIRHEMLMQTGAVEKLTIAESLIEEMAEALEYFKADGMDNQVAVDALTKYEEWKK